MFLKILEKHSVKSVIKTEAKLMLLTNIYSKTVYKNKNGACCEENKMGSEVEATWLLR